MSKLREGKELARVEQNVTTYDPVNDKTHRVRHLFALFENGTIFENSTWFRPDGMVDLGGKWRLWGRARQEDLIIDHTFISRWVDSFVARGFSRIEL